VIEGFNGDGKCFCNRVVWLLNLYLLALLSRGRLCNMLDIYRCCYRMRATSLLNFHTQTGFVYIGSIV